MEAVVLMGLIGAGLLLNKDKNIEPIIDTTDYSLRYQLKNRDRSVVEDTLVAPEKRVERHQYTSLKLYENTRGDPDDYQLLGVLFNNTVNKTYQLFGRRTHLLMFGRWIVTATWFEYPPRY